MNESPQTPARPLGLLGLALVAALGVGAIAHFSHAQRDRLRVIVQEQCVPHWLATHQPSPCSRVELPGSDPGAQGYAVLHDRKGGAHFLLIPTRTVAGIESPGARAADAANYFDAAWKAREVLNTQTGFPLDRSSVGLAVNPLRARSQDQLHIHISCLRADTSNALEQQAQQVGMVWTTFELDGHSYHAMRVMGEDLAPANPIHLLAERVPGAQDHLADYTMLVAGETFAEGPGFLILAAQGVPGAELLLDARCSAARRAPGSPK
jgi:CDP-diacylglycerol pyrophosphatase